MTRTVCIGECMIEMAPTDTEGAFRMGFAGDTMNTAWYLRRLLGADHQVDYLTAIGTDSASQQMSAFLQQAGLGVDSILRRSDRTVGLYVIRLDNGERSFSYWRGQSAARTLAQDKAALTAALSDADYAYFSGITIAILPPEDRARLRDALAVFRANGGQVVFDPNLRPALWSDPQEMRDEIMAGAAVSTIVLPSHEDEATWFDDRDPAATASRYAACGAQTVVVKNGSGPMLTCVDRVLKSHDPVTVQQVIDTTAAGDSFNAGFLASIIRGAALSGAVQNGAQVAAQVIQSRGALVDLT
ncbi:2-dehydro-3-deoxygluconokinase [Loktanella sp. DSM 29012]|uniref:sugar kinase n=1 Tax=Loktanella sp. DSM 29012 TaxID=1881056 RepID=UPI0008AC61A6|nr:sugar kinase [Loktanella sp. DSM 29012]SEQ38313.1 2-dehydro-3-deoxygluconokinase [Loktanella sp. DSM 29012]